MKTIVDLFSINHSVKSKLWSFLQICDADLNILSVDASFGGATHDSFVWNQHPVKNKLITLNNAGERVFLLGIFLLKLS